MTPYPDKYIREISGWFINTAVDYKCPMHAFSVFKLLYIIQGYHLAIFNKPFFETNLFALKYGPAVLGMRRYLKVVSDKDWMIRRKQIVHTKFSEYKTKVLTIAFHKFLKSDQVTMRTFVNGKGTPWHNTQQRMPNDLIEKSLIKEYFKGIINLKSFNILYVIVENELADYKNRISS